MKIYLKHNDDITFVFESIEDVDYYYAMRKTDIINDPDESNVTHQIKELELIEKWTKQFFYE